MKDKLQKVCRDFCIQGEFLGYEMIQVGNVNKTYRVDFRMPDGTEKSFLVQNVNTYAFRNPVGLMDNIDKITEHIRSRTTQKVSLHFHHTQERRTYVIDGSDFWRLTNYIPSVTFNTVSDLDIVRNAGRAFGEFQMSLNDFEISQLCETIPGFHNTRGRYAALEQAVAEDAVGRVEEVREELNWLEQIRDTACTLTDLANAGRLPLHVTHNDTKINNVLFDERTGEALTVIDLDTVMPGLIGHDYGDAIRFAANKVEEDCPDISRVGLDLTVFRAFTEGFLEKTSTILTPEEKETLAVSCVCLTAELAVRFLEDYIRGDCYFTIHYPSHNLVRTRSQIALCKDMMEHLPEMQAIILKCLQ